MCVFVVSGSVLMCVVLFCVGCVLLCCLGLIVVVLFTCRVCCSSGGVDVVLWFGFPLSFLLV